MDTMRHKREAAAGVEREWQHRVRFCPIASLKHNHDSSATVTDHSRGMKVLQFQPTRPRLYQKAKAHHSQTMKASFHAAWPHRYQKAFQCTL